MDDERHETTEPTVEPPVRAPSPFERPPVEPSSIAIGPPTEQGAYAPLLDPGLAPFAPPPGAVEATPLPIGPPTTASPSPLINPARAWVPPPPPPVDRTRPTSGSTNVTGGTDVIDGTDGIDPDDPDGGHEPLAWFRVGAAPEDREHAGAVAEHRPRWRTLASVVVALAVLCGAGFGYLSFVAPDGATTPEAAVRSLVDALDHEDAIGVLESLPPSERAVIREPALELVDELRRLGVLTPFALESVPGVDVTVDGLTVEVEPAGQDARLRSVRITGGTLTVHVDRSLAPAGEALRTFLADDLHVSRDADGSYRQDLGSLGLRLITVDEQRGWHVSLFYSVIESWRDHASVPDFGGGPDPVGATSPEGAVVDLANAAAALDAARAITLLDPTELRAAYDAAPLFLPALNRDLRDRRDDDFGVTIDRLETKVDGEGSERRVTITALDVTVGDRRSTTHLTYDGSCAKLDEVHRRRGRTQSVEHTEACADAGTTESPRTIAGGVLGAFGILGGFAGNGIAVVERDGRWYVRPVTTVLEDLVTSARRLTPDDVTRLGHTIGAARDAAAEAPPTFGGGPPTRTIPQPPTGPPTTTTTPGAAPGAAPGSTVPGNATGTDSIPGTPTAATGEPPPSWNNAFPKVDCFNAGPAELPPGASPDRVAFLYDEAVRLCFNQAGEEYSPVDECYAPYIAIWMRPGVGDDQWHAADLAVATCRQARSAPPPPGT